MMWLRKLLGFFTSFLLEFVSGEVQDCVSSSLKDGQGIKHLLVVPLRATAVSRTKIDTLCLEKSKIMPYSGKGKYGLQWEHATLGEINLK